MRPVPGPPSMLIKLVTNKESKKRKISTLRKFLLGLWEVISPDCFFLYKLLAHLFTYTGSNIFIESVVCARRGTGPLGCDNELDTVSALKEQSEGMGGLHPPQILGDSEKGQQHCQKLGV